MNRYRYVPEGGRPAGAGDPLAGAARAAPGGLPRLRLARVGGRQRVAAAGVPEPLYSIFLTEGTTDQM